jgi:clan AA aspartic protease
MGLVYADIEIVSAEDLALARRGYIKEENVKSEKVRALVDSGAYMMCINEHIQAQLDLAKVSSMEAELADGTIRIVDVVGPIVINFSNRTTSCNAAVLPGESEVLLGAIPMEDLDVVIDPKLQTITLPKDRPYLAKKTIK